jgi:hypothetical protein
MELAMLWSPKFRQGYRRAIRELESRPMSRKERSTLADIFHSGAPRSPKGERQYWLGLAAGFANGQIETGNRQLMQAA